MKKSKQLLIEEYKLKPFQAGDPVYLKWETEKTTNHVTGKGKKKAYELVTQTVSETCNGKVVKTDGDTSLIDTSGTFKSIPEEMILRSEGHNLKWVSNERLHHNTSHVGAFPFADEKYSLNYLHQDINSLLFYMDYDHTRKKERGAGGIDFDPYIIDANGQKQYFQRGHVWTLEQKQALISSIYMHIGIGSFVLAYYDWNEIAKRKNDGLEAFQLMCIDGKQRLTAILEFVQGKFPDEYGNYWDDLSAYGQITFSRKNVSVCMLKSEEITPAFIKQIFLGINFTGTPMSREHIYYVKSIQV